MVHEEIKFLCLVCDFGQIYGEVRDQKIFGFTWKFEMVCEDWCCFGFGKDFIEKFSLFSGKHND